MNRAKKVMIVGAALVVAAAATTGICARIRESRVLQVKPGMQKKEVERLLGPGTEDVMSPACDTCPKERQQFAYNANPSLWYGRFEDTLVVCYVADIVCGTTRVGL